MSHLKKKEKIKINKQKEKKRKGARAFRVVAWVNNPMDDLRLNLRLRLSPHCIKPEVLKPIPFLYFIRSLEQVFKCNSEADVAWL